MVGPTLRVHHKNSSGNVINPYQKPAYIAYQLCKTFALPLDTILIVGFGAGGDIEGASAAGMSVVAIEMEKTQFDATLAIWRTHQQQLIGGVPYETLFPSIQEGRFGSLPVDFDIPERFVSRMRATLEQFIEEEKAASEPTISCASCDVVLGKRKDPYPQCTACETPVCDKCVGEVKEASSRTPFPDASAKQAVSLPNGTIVFGLK
jgi:hypothetical protein